MKQYYPPIFLEKAFHCPHCSVYANQTWSAMTRNFTSRNLVHANFWDVDNLQISRCSHCNQDALWMNGTLIFPESTTAPLPNPDMPEDVKEAYLEASLISTKSPRGAAALLRLAIQKLCVHL